jgi:hypothetical protein
VPSLPTGVGYATVTWTAEAAVMDTIGDIDVIPDVVPVLGQVTFSPSVAVFRVPDAIPPVTLFASSVTATLYTDGTLRDAHGNVGVTLLATDSPGLDVEPDSWAWTASFNLQEGRTLAPFSFHLESGTTVDLTTVIPATVGVGGLPITQGRGIIHSSVDLDGNLVLFYTDGTSEIAGYVIGPPGDANAYGSAMINVKNVAYGAVGNGIADDTAAINAAMDAARFSNGKRGGTVYIPRGRYRITAPINLYTNVSIRGENWALDPTTYNASAIVADGSFVGSAMILQNADGRTVSDPTTRPDESWHQGKIQFLTIQGNGKTGPHGIDPGWTGETSSIESVQFVACKSAIYLNDIQISLTLSTVSMFDCDYGLNCDDITGGVRVFGISGRNNTSLVRVNGDAKTHVEIFGLQSESFTAGNGDPVIDIEDLDGGRFTLIGGWSETDSARTHVIRLSQSVAVNPANVVVMGFDANSLYTYLLDDTTWASQVAPVTDGDTSPSIFWNGPLITGGETVARLGGGTGTAAALGNAQAGFFGAALATQPTAIYPNTGQLHAALKSLGLIDDTTAVNPAAPNIQTAAYQFVLADRERPVVVNSATDVTLTIPASYVENFPVGSILRVSQTGAGIATVAAGTDVTLHVPDGYQARTAGVDTTIFAYQRILDEWVLYAGELRLLTTPTQTYHPIRKDYADTKIARIYTKNSVSANYTLVAADAIDVVLHTTAASGITITLPQDSAATIAQDISIPWRQFGAGQITFAAGTGATLISLGSVFKSAGQNARGRLVKVAANTWLLSGNITA